MTTITPSGSFEVGPGDVIVIGMQSLHKMIGNAVPPKLTYILTIELLR